MKSPARAMCAFFITIALCILLAACASMGRPEGGPRDETPPVYMRSSPGSGARNYNNNKVEVWFDENIQLDDAFNKVIVSPTQKQAAVVRSPMPSRILTRATSWTASPWTSPQARTWTPCVLAA